MELPKFVTLNGTALRLKGNRYYRDGGDWSVGYKIIDDVLVSWAHGLRLLGLHKKPLIEITEEEWRKDNGPYAPYLGPTKKENPLELFSEESFTLHSELENGDITMDEFNRKYEMLYSRCINMQSKQNVEDDFKSRILEHFDTLEQNGVFIHYNYDHYTDGTNCNFSIEFTNQKTQTGWYGDNHEFGEVKDVMLFSIKLALWYLDNPKYIDLINSGYHESDYMDYVEKRREFIKEFLKD
jgi:hypothetical protein